MSSRVRYLALATMDSLYESVEDNLDRYKSGSFADLAEGGGWNAELSITMDERELAKLVPEKGPDAEVKNSVIVGMALLALTPSLATEGRLWARLAHLDCIEYCRARWLAGVDDAKLPDTIRTHFFANSLTQYRDDHALSRLWWNYHIASLLSPEDPILALRMILKTADIRSNFVERPWISTRLNLSRGIFRQMCNDTWVTEAERHFREFMKAINRQGAGVVFEVMSDSEVDEVLQRARDSAKVAVGGST